METLISILDDCAALGDVNKLKELRYRWQRRDIRWGGPCGVIRRAIEAKAVAVEVRLKGNAYQAGVFEKESYFWASVGGVER